MARGLPPDRCSCSQWIAPQAGPMLARRGRLGVADEHPWGRPCAERHRRASLSGGARRRGVRPDRPQGSGRQGVIDQQLVRCRAGDSASEIGGPGQNRTATAEGEGFTVPGIASAGVRPDCYRRCCPVRLPERHLVDRLPGADGLDLLAAEDRPADELGDPRVDARLVVETAGGGSRGPRRCGEPGRP